MRNQWPRAQMLCRHPILNPSVHWKMDSWQGVFLPNTRALSPSTSVRLDSWLTQVTSKIPSFLGSFSFFSFLGFLLLLLNWWYFWLVVFLIFVVAHVFSVQMWLYFFSFFLFLVWLDDSSKALDLLSSTLFVIVIIPLDISQLYLRFCALHSLFGMVQPSSCGTYCVSLVDNQVLEICNKYYFSTVVCYVNGLCSVLGKGCNIIYLSLVDYIIWISS